MEASHDVDQDTVSSRTRESASSEKFYSTKSQLRPHPTSSGIKHDHQLNFTNPKISSVIWRLSEFVRRSSKFHHLQCVLKIVKHHDVSVLIQSYETYQAFSTNMVCKVRVKTASDQVRGLLGLSCGWSDSLSVLEGIAKTIDEETNGVDSL